MIFTTQLLKNLIITHMILIFKWGGVNNGSSWLALIDADVILA